ncbi:hypothetical protein LX36DRAFT_704140 [Colletotrichum falcatum]|nr:hypothetical protein LX36DRAFT_704140 [Colletotrichum falcatum]
MEAQSIKGYPCQVPTCTSKPFPTKGNLNRHIKSKHSPPVPMPCGKLLKNQPCNIQRHQKSCRACCRELNVEWVHHEPNHASPGRLQRPLHTAPPDAHGTPAPHDNSVYMSPLGGYAAPEERSQMPLLALPVNDNQLFEDFARWQDQMPWAL